MPNVMLSCSTLMNQHCWSHSLLSAVSSALCPMTITVCWCRYWTPVAVWCIVINPSICVSVCLSLSTRAYHWNRRTDPHEILWADPLWLWLSPPPPALRYVMYFRYMDKVTFGCNGCDTERWRLHRAAMAMNDMTWQSLMSMNACC